MSEREVAFFDFKEHEPGNLQLGGMVVSSETLDSIKELAYFILPNVSNDFRKNKQGATFLDLSEHIYNMLNGKIWVGHDIIKRDIPRLRREFKKIGRDFPEPKSVVDTVLFTSSNTRLAKLAVYCSLGETKLGSCFDCRKNLNSIKECETIKSIVRVLINLNDETLS
ncbi:unnamed protein product [Microthlaspi erraticum]|uniref:Exonuclease domain-containing protein n=1 Tax=Microthlaspi erraticum TaxID=1685480 RepID=A0A6D2I8N5_9BRAS|nr:unnamed protein product [Microthlaspi erraticum]